MKRIVFYFFVIISFTVFAQNEDMTQKLKSHELKLDVYNPLAFKAVAGSYEYLLSDDASLGLSVLYNFNDLHDRKYQEDQGIFELRYNEKYAITTYYRRFFSKKRAWGFFIEGFGTLNEQQDIVFGEYNTNTNDYNYTPISTTNFAMGIAVGGKFVTKKGFILELYAGLGRNLIVEADHVNSDIGSDSAVPRIGLSIGKRF